MSKKQPRVLVKDLEGRDVVLTNCIVVGRTEEDDSISLSYSSQSFPDTLKMVGECVVLISTIMTSMQKASHMPKEELENLLSLTTMLAKAKASIVERHSEVSYYEEDEEDEEEDLEFTHKDMEKFINFLKDRSDD